MYLAHEAARRAGHIEIMPGHLLSGLLAQKDSTAGRVLEKLGVSADALREDLEQNAVLGSGPFDRLIVFSRPAAHLIDLAYDEARQLKHTHVGTEHLLLALVREPEGALERSITEVGLDLTAVRAAVRQTQGWGSLVRSSSVPTMSDALLRSVPTSPGADPATMLRPSSSAVHRYGRSMSPRLRWTKLLLSVFRIGFFC